MRTNRRPSGPLASAGMVSLWGASSLIKSIQYGTVSFLAANSPTATITAVDVANSVVYRLGASSDGVTVNPQYAAQFSTVILTNATTVTGNLSVGSYGANNVESFCVVEYRPGVVRSIQTGTVAVTGTGIPNVTTGTATVTQVDAAKAQLFFGGFISNYPGSGTGFLDQDSAGARITLTNGTTITATTSYVNTYVLTSKFTLLEYF